MARIALSLFFCVALAAFVSAGNRIIDGTVIQISQVPFAAAFLRVQPQGNLFFHTGGVVITSRHILSAAHSFLTDNDIYYVRLGSSFWQTGGVIVSVERAINHPDFHVNTLDADITVVVLSEPVLIGGGTGINNAILPHPTTVLQHNTPISVAGWGLTEFGGPSSQLRNIDIFIVDLNLCRTRYPGMSLTTGMFCAGILDTVGISPCSGDSGGPAYSGGVAYGLVSFGDCGRSGRMPTVFANVAAFIPWIVDNVNAS